MKDDMTFPEFDESGTRSDVSTASATIVCALGAFCMVLAVVGAVATFFGK